MHQSVIPRLNAAVQREVRPGRLPAYRGSSEVHEAIPRNGARELRLCSLLVLLQADQAQVTRVLQQHLGHEVPGHRPRLVLARLLANELTHLYHRDI